MKNLETKKFKKLGINFLFFIVFAAHMAISIGISFSKSSLKSDYFLYRVIDTYIFISLLINPIILSSLSKKTIEIEEKNNMWQLQISLGESVTQILLNKFKILSTKLLVLQIIEWSIMIAISTKLKLFIFNADTLVRLGILFLATLFTNLFLLALFMIIEMKAKKVYFTSFLSIIGALSGIICMLTSETLSYINPFAWLSSLLNISYVKKGNELVQMLNPLQYYTLIISFVFLIFVIVYMKNMTKYHLEKE